MLPPEERPIPGWKTSLALWLVISAALANFTLVFHELTWWFVVVVFCALVLALVAGTRAALAARGSTVAIVIVPFLVGIVATVLLLGVYFVPGTTFLAFPTGLTLESLVVLGQAGVQSIQDQSTPAIAEPGIMLLLMTGIAVLAVTADHLALTLGRPAPVGILVLPVAVTPAMIAGNPVNLFWLAATAFAYLYLLSTTREHQGRRGWDAVAIGASALAAALVLPVLMPTPSGIAPQGEGGGGSIVNGVNPLISLGNDLRRETDRPALNYSTTSGDSHYLRLLSLDTFGDEGWTLGEGRASAPAADRESPNIPGLSPEVEVSPEQSFVRIRDLGGSWLPVPYPALTVEGLRNEADWDLSTLALRSSSRSIKGEEYVINSLVLEPTAEQLQATGSRVAGEVEAYAVTDATWPVVIGDTAREVTLEASTNYERAVALQEFFRAGDFEYSETAPVENNYEGSSAEVIAAFLEVKSGYCVHFASAMAVMARSLGIPSRVAVGFLPGTELKETDEGRRVWEVTSSELHSWPELYFEDIGWVPFEPTTSRGVIPDYSTGLPEGAPDPDGPSQAPAPSAPAPSAPGSGQPDQQDPGLGGGQAQQQRGVPWPLIVAIGAALLLLVPAVARLLQRGIRLRRLRALPGGAQRATLAWNEIVQTAVDAGIAVAGTQTPRENAAVIARVIGGSAALDEALLAMERGVFASADSAAAAPEAPSLAAVTEVVRHIHDSLEGRERWRALLWPPSTIRRMLKVVS